MRKISIYLIFLLSITHFVSAQKRSNGRFGHDLPGVFYITLSGVGPAYLFGDVGGQGIKSKSCGDKNLSIYF